MASWKVVRKRAGLGSIWILRLERLATLRVPTRARYWILWARSRIWMGDYKTSEGNRSSRGYANPATIQTETWSVNNNLAGTRSRIPRSIRIHQRPCCSLDLDANRRSWYHLRLAIITPPRILHQTKVDLIILHVMTGSNIKCIIWTEYKEQAMIASRRWNLGFKQRTMHFHTTIYQHCLINW